MSTDEYVPSDEDMRKRHRYAWESNGIAMHAVAEADAQWSRWLAAHDARVRRDAAREALDGLARLAVQVEDGHGQLVPAERVRDDWAMVEIAARTYRDTHYPEETP